MKKQALVLTMAMLFAGTSFGAIIQCPSTKYVVKKLMAVSKKHPSPLTYTVGHEGQHHVFATEFPNQEAKNIFLARLIGVRFFFSPDASGVRDASSMYCSYKVTTTTGHSGVVVFADRMRGTHLDLIGDYWNLMSVNYAAGENVRTYECDEPNLWNCRVELH